MPGALVGTLGNEEDIQQDRQAFFFFNGVFLKRFLFTYLTEKDHKKTEQQTEQGKQAPC